MDELRRAQDESKQSQAPADRFPSKGFGIGCSMDLSADAGLKTSSFVSTLALAEMVSGDETTGM
jgi:hypothetical protein